LSAVRYPPVISQYSKTKLGSRGLIVGEIMVPPPPGPMTFQALSRGACGEAETADKDSIRTRVWE
jgi:hypothetical protein